MGEVGAGKEHEREQILRKKENQAKEKQSDEVERPRDTKIDKDGKTRKKALSSPRHPEVRQP